MEVLNKVKDRRGEIIGVDVDFDGKRKFIKKENLLNYSFNNIEVTDSLKIVEKCSRLPVRIVRGKLPKPKPNIELWLSNM